MSQAIEAVLKKLSDRMGTLEQCVQSVGHGDGLDGKAADAIRKALMSGPASMHGWVGGDGAQLTDIDAMHKLMHRPKSIGMGNGTNKAGDFGTWLQTVAGGGISNVSGITMPHEVVQKRMKEFGSGSGESYWSGGSVKKAPNAEGTGATGGYLVPTQFYMKLLQFVAERSFVKAMCTTLPMAGRELYFPYLNQQQTTASSTANFPASNFYGGVYFSWTPEGATYPQTNPLFQSGKLVCRDLVGISICSNQLIQDSAVAIDTLFTTLFADALAWQMDYAFLRGNGVNQPLGILNAPGTISSARAASNNLLTSLSDMIGRAMNVGSDWNSYCWVINQSVLPYLIRMTNGATNAPFLTFMNPAPSTGTPISAQWPMMLFGIPVYITEKLPAYTSAGDICLLDMSKYLCGDRMSIQVEASQWPYFTSNQMVWRTIARFDGQPWFNAPTTLADGTTTVSPHVILAA